MPLRSVGGDLKNHLNCTCMAALLCSDVKALWVRRQEHPLNFTWRIVKYICFGAFQQRLPNSFIYFQMEKYNILTRNPSLTVGSPAGPGNQGWDQRVGAARRLGAPTRSPCASPCYGATGGSVNRRHLITCPGGARAAGADGCGGQRGAGSHHSRPMTRNRPTARRSHGAANQPGLGPPAICPPSPPLTWSINAFHD